MPDQTVLDEQALRELTGRLNEDRQPRHAGSHEPVQEEIVDLEVLVSEAVHQALEAAAERIEQSGRLSKQAVRIAADLVRQGMN